MSKCLALHHTMKRWNIFEGTVETFFFSVCDNPGLCSICKTTINHPPSLKRLSPFVPKNLAHLLTYEELFNNEEVSLFTLFSVMFEKKKSFSLQLGKHSLNCWKKVPWPSVVTSKIIVKKRLRIIFFSPSFPPPTFVIYFFLSISFCTPWMIWLICFTNLRRFPIQQVPLLGEKKRD